MRAISTIALLVLLIASSQTALSGASAESAKPETPDFGPHVRIFDPSMTNIQSRIDDIFRQQERSQFASNRYALFFKPGQYDLDVQVGFYTQVLGLAREDHPFYMNGCLEGFPRPETVAAAMFWKIKRAPMAEVRYSPPKPPFFGLF